MSAYKQRTVISDTDYPLHIASFYSKASAFWQSEHDPYTIDWRFVCNTSENVAYVEHLKTVLENDVGYYPDLYVEKQQLPLFGTLLWCVFALFEHKTERDYVALGLDSKPPILDATAAQFYCPYVPVHMHGSKTRFKQNVSGFTTRYC